ncbi:MAG: chloride channel protein [Rugosibacter sp.]
MNLFKGRLSARRWRIRLTLWIAAICSGAIIVGFAKLADTSLAFFFFIISGRPWLPFLLGPLIGMLVVWLTEKYFPGGQGSGIPQVIAARRLAIHGHAVDSLVSLRIATGKIFLGALALLGGFSAGKEGPSVQVAASILHFFHRFFPDARMIRPSDLILAGGAAGIAAAFNTPLAGIVFVVEELGRKLETRTSGVLLSTIILAGLVSTALAGNYNYFGHLKVGDIGVEIIMPVILGGIMCGLLGGIFSQLLLWPQKKPHLTLWQWRATHPVLFAGGCGLVIASIGWISGGVSYGSGYIITTKVVAGEITLPWYTPIARFVATITTYYSGIPGGIFAPALAIGASLGANAANFLGIGSSAIPFMALCMAGFLAAVTQAPITSAIIVMEMIDGHGMVISLMSIALIAKAVSSRLGPELYQQLSRAFHSNQ